MTHSVPKWRWNIRRRRWNEQQKPTKNSFYLSQCSDENFIYGAENVWESRTTSERDKIVWSLHRKVFVSENKTNTLFSANQAHRSAHVRSIGKSVEQKKAWKSLALLQKNKMNRSVARGNVFDILKAVGNLVKGMKFHALGTTTRGPSLLPEFCFNLYSTTSATKEN